MNKEKRSWSQINCILTICQNAEYILELYIRIQIRINQLLIFNENSQPWRDLNLGLPEYQADALPIELSRLGLSQY